MPSGPQVRIRLLSGFSITAGSGAQVPLRGSKVQGLVAYLALQENYCAARQKLLGLLWSDRAQAQAQASLRTSLSEIRMALRNTAPEMLRADGEVVSLDRETVTVDALDLLHAVTEPHVAPDTIPVWSGDLLANLDSIDPQYDEWLFFERTSIRERYCAAVQARIHDAVSSKKWDLASGLAQSLLNVDPANEVAHRARMMHFVNRGDSASALRQYETLRQTLARVLDAAPSRETEYLAKSIRVGGSMLPVAELSSIPTPSGGITSSEETRERELGVSVAVIPFENVGGDDSYDYIGEGMAENITNYLCLFRDLMVISAHSAFSYRGKRTSVTEISQELGARFVLAGAVHKSGEKLRISAHLIDGATGQHLWAQHYDRVMKDVMSVQDEVAGSIVATVGTAFGGRIRKALKKRPRNPGQRKLEACDHFLRAMEHSDRFTKRDCALAKEHCIKAMEIEPSYGKAIAKLAWQYLFEALFGWSDNSQESWKRAFEYAALAVERDDDEAWGHCVLGACYFYSRKPELGLASYRRALNLNPNDADVMADFGCALSYSGEPQEGIGLILKAMRLNPHHPEWYRESIGQAYFDAGRYTDAIAAYESLRTISHIFVRLYLAASHAALGHDREAEMAMQRVYELDSAATIGRWANAETTFYVQSKSLEHFRLHLRAAGLPD